jgi:hypothetical protein
MQPAPWPTWEEVNCHAVVDFEDFLGKWKDDKGSLIVVARPGPDESQNILNVTITPLGKRRDIQVALTKLPNNLGGYMCGLYGRFDFHNSHSEKLVWLFEPKEGFAGVAAEDRVWVR